jgi:hypothetical protein
MTGPRATEREALKKWRDDGLLWLVNTSVLHPRGYALAIHFEEGADFKTALPLGLSVVGDGSEPWCFGEEPDGSHQSDEPFADFKRSESAREAEWSPKLRGES